MKKIISLSLLITLIVVLTVSCLKDDKYLVQSETFSTKSTNNYALLSVCENLGFCHNSVLEYVGDNCNPMKDSRETRFMIANRFLGCCDTWVDKQSVFDTIEYHVYNGDIIEYISEKEIFSDSSLLVLSRINNLFEYACLSAQDSNVFSSRSFSDSIASIITYIFANFSVEYNDSTGDANEYASLVSYCYLANSTYNYWFNQANNINNNWFEFLELGNYAYSSNPKPNGFFGRIWRGIKIAAVDTWTFIADWDVNNPTGSINGEIVVTITVNGYVWNSTHAVNSASEASSSVH